MGDFVGDSVGSKVVEDSLGDGVSLQHVRYVPSVAGQHWPSRFNAAHPEFA